MSVLLFCNLFCLFWFRLFYAIDKPSLRAIWIRHGGSPFAVKDAVFVIGHCSISHIRRSIFSVHFAV